jgi:predicted nucleotidyltransferase
VKSAVLNSVSHSKATINYRTDGILHIHYADDALTIEDSIEIFKLTRQHAPWEVAPIYLTGGGFTNTDSESKKYNSSPEVIRHCSAIAFLSPTLGQKMMANFFIKFYKPAVPTKFFLTEEEAINWLKQFLS